MHIHFQRISFSQRVQSGDLWGAQLGQCCILWNNFEYFEILWHVVHNTAMMSVHWLLNKCRAGNWQGAAYWICNRSLGTPCSTNLITFSELESTCRTQVTNYELEYICNSENYMIWSVGVWWSNEDLWLLVKSLLLFPEGSTVSWIELSPRLEKVYGSDPTVGYGKLH